MLTCNNCNSTDKFERSAYLKYWQIVDSEDTPTPIDADMEYGEELGDREYVCLNCQSRDVEWK